MTTVIIIAKIFATIIAWFATALGATLMARETEKGLGFGFFIIPLFVLLALVLA